MKLIEESETCKIRKEENILDIDDRIIFPLSVIMKCSICNREIPVKIINKEGLIHAIKYKEIHNKFESVLCEGMLEYSTKNKKWIKNDKNEERDNITFDELISRDIIVKTRSMLEESLILFPKNNFKIETSGMILYGPNGTGKTEFSNALCNDHEFQQYCDFEELDIYDLIDSKMGASSENIAQKVISWKKAYKETGKIQVKIIDEGELVFLDKRDKSSKAYAELSRSMLKHSGKFQGFYIIILTNDLNIMARGAISRFEKIYWALLNTEEIKMFIRNRLERLEIKFNLDNFDSIIPCINYKHFGDIRTHNKLMRKIKGYYVRSYNKDMIINVEELILLLKEFNGLQKEENENISNYNEDISNYNEDIILGGYKKRGLKPITGKIIDVDGRLVSVYNNVKSRGCGAQPITDKLIEVEFIDGKFVDVSDKVDQNKDKDNINNDDVKEVELQISNKKIENQKNEYVMKGQDFRYIDGKVRRVKFDSKGNIIY